MDEFIVNQHIMEICKQRNLSIYRLAKMSDMPYSSLNNMIKHRHVPTIYNLIKICNVSVPYRGYSFFNLPPKTRMATGLKTRFAGQNYF